MTQPSGEPEVTNRPRVRGFWPPTPRGWYIARMVAFVYIFVSQVMGLAAHREGELVRLRIAVIALTAVFLVATTIDFGRMRNGL